MYTRPVDATPALSAGDEPLLFDFHLFDLLSALKDVMARVPDEKFEITAETVSITEKISQNLARLEVVDSILFADLFAGNTSTAQVIGTFLAILELIKTRVVKAFQIEQFGAIRIMKAVAETPDSDTVTGNLFG